MNTEFFDINKLPKEYGILVFPISISRTENGTGQDPQQCLEYIQNFSSHKIAEPKVGLNMIYGDFLYFHSKEEARVLKQKNMNLVLKHKNAFHNLVRKEKERFQIQHAFSYEVWNQMYLSYDGDFDADFKLFKKMYAEDPIFQKYIMEDIERAKREVTEDQINFFLEEHLLFYLLTKKRISLPNEYIQGREKWVLNCYPEVPLKGEIYTYQMDPFKLSVPENKYENCFYDLEAKKLVDMTKIDLGTYNYSYSTL